MQAGLPSDHHGMQRGFVYGADWAYGWCLGKYDPLKPLQDLSKEEWRQCAVFHTEQEFKYNQKCQKQQTIIDRLKEALAEAAWLLEIECGDEMAKQFKKALAEYKGEQGE
jgi:hypothetical protein